MATLASAICFPLMMTGPLLSDAGTAMVMDQCVAKSEIVRVDTEIVTRIITRQGTRWYILVPKALVNRCIGMAGGKVPVYCDHLGIKRTTTSPTTGAPLTVAKQKRLKSPRLPGDVDRETQQSLREFMWSIR